ncbi:hypothetical protein N7513_012941 [Penicillium frequentans]|nr:hypothetical protein N7513_012941 [Penicillium glabrum]
MASFWTTRSALAKLGKFSAVATLAGAGAWQLWTMHCYFEPLGPEYDPIFQSDHYKRHNPGDHPSLKDSCVRKVSLSQIPPDLVEDALKGGSKLLERFCAGVWGGYGYAIQRNILARLGRNGSNEESILWDKKQLLNSTYKEGTNVTDHFVVVGKTPRSVILWGPMPRLRIQGSHGIWKTSPKLPQIST